MPNIDTKQLNITLETQYKGTGLEQAEKGFKGLGDAGEKTSTALNKTAMDLGSTESKVAALYGSLSKATPENLRYAQSFQQIQKDLQSGKISIEEAKTKIENLAKSAGMSEEAIKRHAQALKEQSGEAKEGASTMELITQGLNKAAEAALSFIAVKFGTEFIKESTLLAARVETLGVVTAELGENAGLTEKEVRKLEEAIKAKGITTQGARQAIAQMVQAEIELSHATDLARLAQDAAVISGENSTQAFEAITTAVAVGNTLLARRRGLLVDFEGAYLREAEAMGKSVDQLTQREKVEIRVNDVLSKGVNIQGAYTAALDTAGKKASSYARHWEEFSKEIGNVALPIYGKLIDAITNITKALNNEIKWENLSEQAWEKGIITMQQQAILFTNLTLSAYDHADATEFLTRLIELNEVAVATSYDTYEDYLAEFGKLEEMADEAKIQIEGMTEAEWESAKSMEMADQAMKNQIAITLELQAAQEAEEEMLLGYSSTLEDFGYKIETVTDLQIALKAVEEDRIPAIDALTKSMKTQGLVLKDVATGMMAYMDVFNAEPGLDMINELMETTSQYIADTMTAAAEEKKADFFWDLYDALVLINPEMAQAMEYSYQYTAYMAELNQLLEDNIIESEEYAALAQQFVDEAMLTMMADMVAELEAYGYEVTTVTEYEEAWLEVQQNRGKQIEELNRLFEEQVKTLENVSDGMTKYVDSFSQEPGLDMAEDLLKDATDHLTKMMEKTASTGNAGYFWELYDALAVLNPELADAMKNSLGFQTLMQELDKLLASGAIDADAYAAAVQSYLDQVAAGVDPQTALEETIDQISTETLPGFEQALIDAGTAVENLSSTMAEPPPTEMLDEITSRLDTIKEKAQEPKLIVEDQATPVLDAIMLKLQDMATTWTITVTVDDQTGATTTTTTTEETVPVVTEQRAMSDPVINSVPAGYDRHGFMLNLRSGEDYAVWKSGGRSPAGMNVSFQIAVGGGASSRDIDEMVYAIVDRLQSLRR